MTHTRPALTPIVIGALALLSMLGPFATDLALPAFPQAADELGTSAAGMQTSLTSFMVGMGVGQLVLGPLSDRWGRRPLLVGAMIVCVVASAAAALSPTIAVLVVARFIQGFTGSVGGVVGRAVVADLTSGVTAARIFGLLIALLGFAPVVAPLLGALLVQIGGWRLAMWVITVIALLTLMSTFWVPESLRQSDRVRGGLVRTMRGFAKLTRSRRFIGLALAMAASFGTLFAWISASPFVLQEQYGFDPAAYAACFAVNAAGFLIAGAANVRLLPRFGAPRVLAVSVAVMTAAVIALLVVVATETSVIAVLACVFLASAASAPLMANATALALDSLSADRRGTASAILGAVESVVGAAVAPVAGTQLALPGAGMALTMAGTTAVTIGSISFAWLNMRKRRFQPTEPCQPSDEAASA